VSKQPVQVGATIVTLNAHVDTIDTQQAAIRQAINDLGDGWNMTDVGARWWMPAFATATHPTGSHADYVRPDTNRVGAGPSVCAGFSLAGETDSNQCLFSRAGVSPVQYLGGTLTVVLAFGLPGSWNNTVFGAVMAGISAAFLFISGFGIIGARIYVVGEWMNIAGTRVLRRVLLVVCIGTVAFAALAAATLAGMAGSGPAAVPILLLLVTAAGAVVGLAAMWRLLGPPRS
jgi:hypothetical protein